MLFARGKTTEAVGVRGFSVLTAASTSSCSFSLLDQLFSQGCTNEFEVLRDAGFRTNMGKKKITKKTNEHEISFCIMLQ